MNIPISYCTGCVLSYNTIMCILITAILLLLTPTTPSVVTLNGGYLTISAAVTTTQIDFQVTYDANVAWLGIIFSSD